MMALGLTLTEFQNSGISGFARITHVFNFFLEKYLTMT